MGAHHGLIDDQMELAEAFMETYYQMYHQFRTGLTPENVGFSINPKASRKDMEIWPEDGISLLGLEIVESLFCNYWLSGDKKFQDQGLGDPAVLQQVCQHPFRWLFFHW